MLELDFEKIITISELNNDVKDIEQIINLAATELNRIKRENPLFNYHKQFLSVRSKDISHSVHYSDFNSSEKKLLACSIMYEDEEFIRLLLAYDITYDKIEKICTNIETFKAIKIANPNSPVLSDSYFKSIIEVLRRITLLAESNLYGIDEYLTINKLMYIVACKKELYLKLQSQKIK